MTIQRYHLTCDYDHNTVEEPVEIGDKWSVDEECLYCRGADVAKMEAENANLKLAHSELMDKYLDKLSNEANEISRLKSDHAAEVERRVAEAVKESRLSYAQLAVQLTVCNEQLAERDAKIGRLVAVLKEVFDDLKENDGCVRYSVANKVEAALAEKGG